MMTKWITAAAAAGALSTASVSQDADLFGARAVAPSATIDPHGYAGPGSERARIVGIASEVRRLVARFAGAAPRDVVAPSTLAELGVDGLALADVVLGLEAHFDIDIDDEDASTWTTVGDMVGYVAKELRGREGAA